MARSLIARLSALAKTFHDKSQAVGVCRQNVAGGT
jgi:hypothetical protein